MATIGIYAGPAADNLSLLPSPVSLKQTHETIWSENTGRAQAGENKAKMIGDVVAEKRTYSIQWGIITATEYREIRAKLKAGFFYFAVATSAETAEDNAAKYYRSELTGEAIQVAGGVRYKGVSVNVIEQ